MTAEEIRAEAIERLAIGQFDIDEHDYSRPDAPARAWDAVPEGVRERYRVDAEPLVAALGDLLPTRAEWAVSWTDTRYGTRERQDASIECRDDAERFRHEYSDNDDYPELTDVRVERRYRTAWKAATA